MVTDTVISTLPDAPLAQQRRSLCPQLSRHPLTAGKQNISHRYTRNGVSVTDNRYPFPEYQILFCGCERH